jgi:DNA helicase-2/ATP-dependent DNA helicase PcrA
MVLVGDPRQITYSTHPSLKHVKYRNGGIKEFIEIECNKNKELCIIDEKTLSKSYRNNEFICNFSSALYPNLDPSKPHEDKNFKNDMVKNKGIFLLKPKDLEKFTKKYKPQILKYQLAEFPDLNFGASKGLGFDRVLIYPTEKIRNYLIDGDLEALSTVKAKFYVAVTRARHSVAILLDYDDEIKYIDGIKRIKYKNIIGKMQNYEHTTK